MSSYRGSNVVYTFGPGPMTPAVKAIIFANIGVFVLSFFASDLIYDLFGLTPRAVIEGGRIWQPVTYLFVHSADNIMHILFNMLFVWMFGTELERRWGTPAFVRYYFITGVGAGLAAIAASILPWAAARATYGIPTIGASGAVYGLIVAWAMLFPHRTILFMLLFPMPARVFALLMGAMAFYGTLRPGGSAVSNIAHLGGFVIGWLYLKGPRDLGAEFRYRMTKWRMERLRRRFDVHKGGRDPDKWRDRIH